MRVCFVIIFIAFSSVVTALPVCQTNASWVDCGNSCQTACNQPPPPPGGCLSCFPACQCNPGFVLNDSNQCISVIECPPPPAAF